MPVPSPGRKRVPRWRTMISPPLTSWPAKTLTPRRLALESRPLREEPSPFLWAIRYLRDLDPRQLLAVARALLVTALGLELEDAQLLALGLADDLGLDLDFLQAVRVEHRVIGAEQHRLEVDGRAVLGVELLDQQVLALLDAVLLASGLDDRVCHLLGLGGLGLGARRAPAATSAAPALGLRW